VELLGNKLLVSAVKRSLWRNYCGLDVETYQTWRDIWNNILNPGCVGLCGGLIPDKVCTKWTRLITGKQNESIIFWIRKHFKRYQVLCIICVDGEIEVWSPGRVVTISKFQITVFKVCFNNLSPKKNAYYIKQWFPLGVCWERRKFPKF
jgi:hypothetical protein